MNDCTGEFTVRQDQEDEDLIGAALRRAYKVQKRTDERFDDLLRRLAHKEASTPSER
jgi:hypothetical protein